jgi:quercetin dioxygenase-like cupin family protein
MAHEGQELEGRDGFRLKLLRITEEVLEMEASYTGQGGFPPEHYHPRQDEFFAVLEGAVKAIVDGVELRYAAGDRFQIPAGTPHQMAGDGSARVHWEIRPALRMAEFFEEAYSGNAGADFYDRFADEFRLSGGAAVS